jgi:hypothetical protein
MPLNLGGPGAGTDSDLIGRYFRGKQCIVGRLYYIELDWLVFGPIADLNCTFRVMLRMLRARLISSQKNRQTSPKRTSIHYIIRAYIIYHKGCRKRK